MKYFVVLCVVAVASVADAGKEWEECMHKMHAPHLHHCCKIEKVKMSKEEIDQMKECFPRPPPPKPDCAPAICMAKKFGISDDEGNIDKKAFEKRIETSIEDPELVKIIKDECINGDVSEYGPPDQCTLVKAQACVHIQKMMNCKEWKDDEQCKNVQDLVETCKGELHKS